MTVRFPSTKFKALICYSVRLWEYWLRDFGWYPHIYSKIHHVVRLLCASQTHIRALWCSDINADAFFFFLSPQRAKRCTRDRCCQSRPSPWRSASWGPCVWPSTAATSESCNTQQLMLIHWIHTVLVIFNKLPRKCSKAYFFYSFHPGCLC